MGLFDRAVGPIYPLQACARVHGFCEGMNTPVILARMAALLLLALALAPAAAIAHSHKKKSLEIVHPWTPAMVEPNIKNIAVYMKLKSEAADGDRLLGGVTPLADKIELIDLQIIGGMRLPSTVAAIDIPARGTRELKPEGAHLLLSGFKKQLHAYDSFEMTLIFEKAGEVVVEVAVEEVETKEPHKH